MARRKNQFMDDGSDSDSQSDNDLQDDSFDPDDPDEAAANELFRNPYGRGKKRTRDQLKEEATYGVWAESDGETRRGGRGVGSSNSGGRTGGGAGGKKKDYLSGQAFVAAGSKPSTSLTKRKPTDYQGPEDNLAPAFRIEAAKEDEEDVAMEMGSSDEDESASGAEDAAAAEEADSSAEEDVQQQENEGDDLPPIPGLARPRSPSPPPPPPSAPVDASASLGFAPRGLGAGRGRGGLGMRSGIGGGGGLGSAGRGGIGSSSAAAPRAAPMFASAGSTLSTVPPLAPSSAPSSGATSPMAGASTPRAGLGSSAPGIGARSAGIGAGGAGTPALGAHRPQESVVEALRKEVSGPAAVAGAADEPQAGEKKERRSFLPAPPGGAKPSFLNGGGAPPKAKLSASESKHFASLASSGSIGMKMLEKMGWSSGTGLGKERQGIVTPIGEGQKVRKKGEGIRAGEKSKGALEEERRRKAATGDGSGDEATTAAAKEEKRAKHAAAWQSAKPKGAKREQKKKTEYKSYEELLAEQGEEGFQQQQELLVDLTGQASLTSLPVHAHAQDTQKLPELRHNLTLLTTTLSSTLKSLAREGAGVAQRRAYLAKEEQRVRALVEAQETRVRRLEQVAKVAQRVKEVAGEQAEVLKAMEGMGAQPSPEDLLKAFEEPLDELLGFGAEYEELGLDELVVAGLAPILRRLWSTWDALTSPTFTVPALRRFRKHFLIDSSLSSPTDALLAPRADPYEEEERLALLRKREAERGMTPYESLMWGIWLPRVRSAINNSWHPSSPSPAIALFTSWAPLLPRWLQDNILDQLILPKLSTALSVWSVTAAKRGEAPPLHALVFPWLEVAGAERMEGVMEEAKRKVRGWVKASWKPRDGVPDGLSVWKDAFSKSDWDSLVLRHVLPPLGAHLRQSFTVNPRQQDLAALEAILAWKPLLRGSMLSQLLEAEFFPKWGDALYVWLCAEPNLEQVAEWYSWWKSYFAEDVVALSGVARGFRKGLDLMNQAMALGEDAKYRLKKPDFTPKHGPSSASSSTANTPRAASSASRRPPPPAAAPEPEEISFRAVVEDMAAAANLVFLPTGKSTGKGQQLFRVSRGIEGRGGATVYLEDDVVWIAVGKEEYEPVGVEEMVRRAQGGK
ncbi:hypothetical protein JCM10213v2_002467 [Rhodosporidiobolus nylandii]